MTPKHQKITTYEKQQDGSTKIASKSYYEELSHYLEEIEKPHLSTDQTLLKDVEVMLKHITERNSPKLTVTITPTKQGYKVTEKYITIKQKF